MNETTPIPNSTSIPNLTLIKRTHHCSFCGKAGHKINQCKDTIAIDLLTEAEEVSIVNYCLYWEWNPTETHDSGEYIKIWLKERTPQELKIISYNFGLKPKTTNIKEDCITILSKKCKERWLIPNDETTITYKFATFSKEKLKKWSEHICKHFRRNKNKIYRRIYNICCPECRFHIDLGNTITNTIKNGQDNKCLQECPICFVEITSSEQIVITDCNHEFCNQCVIKYVWLEVNKNEDLSLCLSCPLCRKNITKLNTTNKETSEILTRFCEPMPMPMPMPTPTPILVTQIITQSRYNNNHNNYNQRTAFYGWLFKRIWFLMTLIMFLHYNITNITNIIKNYKKH